MPDCWVPGVPAPQGSKRHVGRGILIESSKAVGPWRERVALAVHGEGWPLRTDAIGMRLDFVLPRPRSAPKTRTLLATKRPDADKLARAVLDALTGIAYVDDSQVIDLHSHKRIADAGERPGVAISLYNPVTERDW